MTIKFEQEQQEEIRSSLGMVLLAIFVVAPFLLLIALITSDIYRAPVGRMLGVSLGDTDRLRIYEATCWREANTHRINVLYWSHESAPVTVTFGELESQLITAEAGIQEIDFILRNQEECPARIILSDESRALSVRSQIARLDQ